VGGGGHRFFEVPALHRAFVLRGAPEVAVILDEFTPTHIDVWRGRAALPPEAALGTPSDAPRVVDGALHTRAVVVRHGGDVTGRVPRFGARRHRLDGLLRGVSAEVPDTPLLAVVLEEATTTVFWVRGEAAPVAQRLSDAGWRTLVPQPPAAVDPPGPV
jgi:hypothetical protein